MKEFYLVVALAAVLVITGCGNKEAGSKSTESAKATPKAMPSITASSEAPPTAVAIPAPPGTPPPPGTPATVATAANAGQFNGLVPKTVDQQGDPMTAEKMLNRALEIYVEGMGKPVPKDLNELVQAKVLQAIPAAPAGKKWEFDAKQGRIVAVNQ